MKYDDIKIGEYYNYNYSDATPGPFKNSFSQLVFIVGRDPFTGGFVATCDKWEHKVSILEDDDFKYMEKI